MEGRIKLTIAPNGAVQSDMTGFKTCASKTKEVLESMDVVADEITTREKDENVQQVSAAQTRVKA